MTVSASIPRRISVSPVAIPNSPMSPIALDEALKCGVMRIDTSRATKGGEAAAPPSAISQDSITPASACPAGDTPPFTRPPRHPARSLRSRSSTSSVLSLDLTGIDDSPINLSLAQIQLETNEDEQNEEHLPAVADWLARGSTAGIPAPIAITNMSGHAPVPISPTSPDTATLGSSQSISQSTPPTSLDTMASAPSIMKQPTSPPSNGQAWAGPSPPRVRISSAQPIARPSPLSRRADGSLQDVHTSEDLLGVTGHPQRTPNSFRHGSSPRGIDTTRNEDYAASPKSPCFIHSHLEKHGQLSEWLRLKAESASASASASGSRDAHKCTDECAGANDDAEHVRDRPSSRSIFGQAGPSQQREHISVTDDMSDAEDGGSLTRQLAETATGVREMSKQLGRTRVRSNIQHVLIVTKARDNRLIKLTRELAIYLMTRKRSGSQDSKSGASSSSKISGSSDRGMVVYVDSQLKKSKRFDAEGIQNDYPELFAPYPRRRSSSSASVNTMSGFASDASGTASTRTSVSGQKRSEMGKEEGQLRYWTSEMCSSTPHLFDFVITLGGDGTVLFTSWLFQRIVPPVLPFALGSLGFLTNFDFADYAKTIDNVVNDGIRVNLRMRFTCTVYRAVIPGDNKKDCNKRKAWKSAGGEILMGQVDKSGWEALEGAHGPKSPMEEQDEQASHKKKKDKEIMCFSTRPVETFEVLNDLVVDRGPSPYVSLLELFGDDNHLTTVQADGLCVSTPTGSTAYSLSAGGSLVHPGIPAILISPICPHTLSFRPMLLPDGMELRICVPYNSRSTAWASFDGRGRVELKQGDHIKVTASKFPFPTVCADKQSTDWFHSISRTLRWNEREKQKSFVVVEEDEDKPVRRKSKSKSDSHQQAHAEAKRIEKNREKAEQGMQQGASASQPSEDDKGKSSDAIGDESDEDEEEEEDQYDIDETSDIGTSSSSPTSKNPPPPSNNLLSATAPRDGQPRSRRLTMDDRVEEASGVNTPSRFAQPYDSPKPLSPRHFTATIDQKLHAAQGDSSRKSSRPVAHQAAVEGERSESRAGEAGLRDALYEAPAAFQASGPQFPRHARKSSASAMEDVRTPRPGSGRQSHHHHGHVRSEHVDQDGHEHKRTKAFAFYGQDESDSATSDEQSD